MENDPSINTRLIFLIRLVLSAFSQKDLKIFFYYTKYYMLCLLTMKVTNLHKYANIIYCMSSTHSPICSSSTHNFLSPMMAYFLIYICININILKKFDIPPLQILNLIYNRSIEDTHTGIC